jgi:hypothetical protein
MKQITIYAEVFKAGEFAALGSTVYGYRIKVCDKLIHTSKAAWLDPGIARKASEDWLDSHYRQIDVSID